MPNRLKALDERLRVAIDSAPNGFLMADTEGRMMLVNREIERMFGYSRAELIGKPIEMLLAESLRSFHARWREDFNRAPVERRMGAGRELNGLHKDGREVPVEIGLNPIETDEGLVVIGSVVDVTERRRAEAERASLEERLRQSQKLEALGRLAGGIAHDFNNILSAVVGYAEMLRADAGSGRDQTADFDGLIEAAERGREVTSRILRFSRRQPLELDPIDLVATVSDAARLLRAALPASIEIELDLDRPDPAVADPGSVQTILMNLGTNAVQAMPQGGRLRVTLERFYARDSFVRANPGLREGSYVKLSVIDSGIGMDAETRSRAFEPFFTTKPVGVGTGLGLSTVHGMMRDHGGTAWLESAPGLGTSVHCLFPAASQPLEREVATSAELEPGRGERILFVDDEAVLASLGARRLALGGYAVVPVGGPGAALERLRAEPFDLMITDFTMPEMDGLALAREARRIRPGLRVLLLTGRAHELEAGDLAEAGILRALEKPVDLPQLTRAVREVLSATGNAR